ncbi:MAG: polymerase primary sigma factor, partial [Myxococcales bacterium]|nr:polymerase primary sigma factor [Myxococcales bacterium]
MAAMTAMTGMFTGTRSLVPSYPTRLKTTSLKHISAEVDLAPDAEPVAPTSHDPLELHFRSMTAFRLLTREDEHALARRLEKADLSLVRGLLAAPEGRAVLLDLARSLRDKETRVEDVERNPGDGLVERIESIVARAESFATRSRSRPKAHGLRLHPRTVRELVRELAELSARQPRNARLRRVIRDVDAARSEADKVTTELVQSNLRIVVTFARRY